MQSSTKRVSGLCLAALLALTGRGIAESGILQYVLAATTQSGPKPFTITFAGTPPSNIVLHADYAGPKTASLALYDSGDGVWHEYSSKTIPVSGGYVAFKGDWRTSAGTYNSMFYNALADTQYTCTFSGSFTNYPTHARAYRQMFYGCTRVTAIVDNPIPLLSGLPATEMFRETYYNMSGVTSLPEGFMDTSGLTGAPARGMFEYACYGMSKVTALPEGFMNTSGLTGAPAVNMFRNACNDMSGVTALPANFLNTSGLIGAPAVSMFGSACNGMSNVTALPENFLNTSGLTGAPADYMFSSACNGMSKVTALPANFLNTSGLTGAPAASMFRDACNDMSGVTNAYTFTFSSNITFTAANVNTVTRSWYNMSNWKGQVLWGTNVLALAIPIPNADNNAFGGCINMPNYGVIHANWK
jgi:hypothetical protein